MKKTADVFLAATAYPRSSSDREAQVRLTVGSVHRHLRIFGDRRVVWERGEPSFEAPAVLDRVRLTHANAYGGRAGEHVYPRNPIGKGFILEGMPFEDLHLPNVEEALDLLTPERLLAKWETWWQQPRPALVEPLVPTNFPRLVHLGFGSVFHAPNDRRLPEVRDGDLPEKYAEDRPIRDGLSQEAPQRSRVPDLPPGTEIVIEGCLPGGKTWSTRAPREPRVRLTVDGRVMDVVVAPQSVRLRPEAGEISITYGIEHKMHRAFIPGVHCRIPIAIQVEETVTHFPTPEPVLARVRKATTEQGAKP